MLPLLLALLFLFVVFLLLHSPFDFESASWLAFAVALAVALVVALVVAGAFALL